MSSPAANRDRTAVIHDAIRQLVRLLQVGGQVPWQRPRIAVRMPLMSAPIRRQLNGQPLTEPTSADEVLPLPALQ
jgi:hypothetical protein